MQVAGQDMARLMMNTFENPVYKSIINRMIISLTNEIANHSDLFTDWNH